MYGNLSFDEAAEFDIKVPEWNGITWLWERSSKPSTGEKLCKWLGIDPRKAKRTVIVIDANYKVTVTTEYD